jgi:hypothetical protein
VSKVKMDGWTSFEELLLLSWQSKIGKARRMRADLSRINILYYIIIIPANYAIVGDLLPTEP